MPKKPSATHSKCVELMRELIRADARVELARAGLFTNGVTSIKAAQKAADDACVALQIEADKA